MQHIPDGLIIPEIFLPRKEIDMHRWATIACDQHSSEPEYWEAAAALVKDAPSTLHIILQEIYLTQPDVHTRIQNIVHTMLEYKERNTVVNMGEQVILLERQTSSGTRTGLLIAIDLEHYNYEQGSKAFIRASEKTLESRLPSRIQTREKSIFDMSHILLLSNKPDICTSFKQYAREPLYSVELMLGGGKLQAISLDLDKAGTELARWMDGRSTDEHLLTGDGNHSLAAAQHIWKRVKAAGASSNDPRRWALVELVSVHDPGLAVHPIHRYIANCDIESIIDILEPQGYHEESRISIENLSAKQLMLHDGTRGFILDFPNPDYPILLPYVEEKLEQLTHTIDYIHGETDCVNIARTQKGVALLLPMISRSAIFPYVEEHGCFPKKAFSLGSAEEKRYYVELRNLSAS